MNQYPTFLINSGKLPKIFLIHNTESESTRSETSWMPSCTYWRQAASGVCSPGTTKHAPSISTRNRLIKSIHQLHHHCSIHHQQTIKKTFSCPISFWQLSPVYIFRNIRATSPSGVKNDLRPSFGLMLFLTRPKFSVITRRGSSFFIPPNSLFSKVE